MKNLVVLNKSGDLIRSKALQNTIFCRVLVNATNIIVFNQTNRIVQIYNFELKLVHSIRLEGEFSYFVLKNYEIVLGNDLNPSQLAMTCYNYKYKRAQSKKKEICINTDELKRILDFDRTADKEYYFFRFFGLNDRFILLMPMALVILHGEKELIIYFC